MVYTPTTKREIHFYAEDFDPILISKGIDPETIREYQWDKFIDMFLEGTHWAEVAEIAAEEIKYQMREDGYWS